MKSFKSIVVATIAGASTLMAVALSTPAQACSLCGIKLNGIELNGLRVNGVQYNGWKINGVEFNGSAKNVAGQIVAVTLPGRI